MGMEAMTPHERASNLLAAVDGCETGEQAIAAIESALRDVVEECARVADDYREQRFKAGFHGGDTFAVTHNIAAAIRRLKE